MDHRVRFLLYIGAKGLDYILTHEKPIVRLLGTVSLRKFDGNRNRDTTREGNVSVSIDCSKWNYESRYFDVVVMSSQICR